MPKFELTAKVNIPLNSNMKIEKGQTFEVNIPWAHLPFDSIQSRDCVKKILSLQGIDIKGHESILSKAYFDIKKI